MDDIVIFKPLSPKDLESVVQLQVKQVTDRLEDKDITLNLQPSAIQHILQVAYNPIYGARPLRRYLEKQVVTQLSRMLISGELAEHSIVHVEAKENNLTYRVEQVTTPMDDDSNPPKRPKV